MGSHAFQGCFGTKIACPGFITTTLFRCFIEVESDEGIGIEYLQESVCTILVNTSSDRFAREGIFDSCVGLKA